MGLEDPLQGPLRFTRTIGEPQDEPHFI